MKLSDRANAFLHEANVCVFATTGPGTWPHAVPMWYLYEDGVITISTWRASQKCKNVERTGKATVVVDRREPPYYAIMIRGDAELGPALSTAAEFRIAARYLGEAGARRFVETLGEEGEAATIRVRPRKLVEYQGSG